MSGVIFLGTKFKSLKADGSVNASGTAEFFEVGGTFSTYKSTYTTSALSVANSNTVTLDSAGEADIWLNGDYDVRIKDSSGTTIDTVTGINPAAAVTAGNFNLIGNPSFETDSNSDTFPDSWDRTVYTGGTAAIDTGDRNHGVNSMKFISTGNGGGTLTTGSFFPVMPNGALSWGFDLKSTTNVRNLVQILWYDASQIALGSPSTDLYDNSATNPTAWTRKQGAVTVPATAYYAKLKIFGCHSSVATAGTARFDNVVVVDDSAKLEGPDIASAATVQVWDGFFAKHITGSTGPISSFGTANYVGERCRITFDGAPILTHSVNLNLPGGVPINVVAGDWAYLYADTTTQIDVEFYRGDGTSVNTGASSAAKIYAYRTFS